MVLTFPGSGDVIQTDAGDSPLLLSSSFLSSVFLCQWEGGTLAFLPSFTLNVFLLLFLSARLGGGCDTLLGAQTDDQAVVASRVAQGYPGFVIRTNAL